MQKQQVLTLPFPSTSIIRGPAVNTEGGDLLLSMTFDADGQHRSTCLRFVKQRAFRKRSEIYCTAWHVADAYDTLCEVTESDWIDELRAASSPEWRDSWVMRHFMVYVDSFGCLEVIAESAVLGEISDKNPGGT
jgi:hypothetical protein